MVGRGALEKSDTQCAKESTPRKEVGMGKEGLCFFVAVRDCTGDQDSEKESTLVPSRDNYSSYPIFLA